MNDPLNDQPIPPVNFDIAISGGKPVEGLLESKDGILKAFGFGPIDYGVTTKEIEEIAAKSVALTVADEQAVIATHQRAKAIRIQIEAKRKIHKEVAIDYGKRVDDGAKALKALIEPIEDSLKAMRDQAEEIRAKAKREAQEVKRALVNSRLKQLAELEWAADAMVVAEMTDEDFDDELSHAAKYFSVLRTKREAEAEGKRIADEAEQERQRLLQEQAEKDRKELKELRALKKQQEDEASRKESKNVKILADMSEEEHKAIMRLSVLLQRGGFDAFENAKILADMQEKINASQKEEREAAAARAAYLQTVKPDAEKIRAFGAALSNWVEANLPTVEKVESIAILHNVGASLDEVCGVLMDFGLKSNGSMPF